MKHWQMIDLKNIIPARGPLLKKLARFNPHSLSVGACIIAPVAPWGIFSTDAPYGVYGVWAFSDKDLWPE